MVQQDIREQRTLEEEAARMEQMPGSVLETVGMGNSKSQIENQQRKKIKQNTKGLEI